MKVVTVVGARPQFIKAAPVSFALAETGHREFLLHTGQHYDCEMSDVFFDELELRQPDANLGVGSAPPGRQTAEMLTGIEQVLMEEKPHCVVVYGDTNSTLAGALAASKLRLPLVHVEAGLRSFNREMPEEHNRVLTDHCSDLLFCPTERAVQNLAREGISEGAHLVGDTMYDAVVQFRKASRGRDALPNSLGLGAKKYLLATLHRPANVDNVENLSRILEELGDLEEPVVFPVHPRTRERIVSLERKGLLPRLGANLKLTAPVTYLEMLQLEESARLILTDSGGVQKEAYFFAVPCVTLRSETEWTETVDSGWNRLAGTDPGRIRAAVREHWWPDEPPPGVYGSGCAAEAIVALLDEAFSG